MEHDTDGGLPCPSQACAACSDATRGNTSALRPRSSWFFDLCLVAAVSFASVTLHHGFVAGHGGDHVLAYVMVFFAIWWAWTGFTGSASATHR